MARDFGFSPSYQSGSYFISYNSEDAKRIAPIAKELHDRGVDMWYDRGLLSGQEWEFQIASQISLCKCVILFATKKLFKRDKGSYVRTEYDMATRSFNKKVIVVMLDDIRDSDVNKYNLGWWYEIRRMQCVGTSDVRAIMEAIGFTPQGGKPGTPATLSMSGSQYYDLGELYYYGRNGQQQNYTYAVKYYRLAADQGYAPAQNNFGNCCNSGHGVKQDFAMAVKYFHMAAAQGDAAAQYNLGINYYLGNGVKRDYKEAVRYFRLAADQGHAGAVNNLGVCCENGEGVPQDYARAAQYYQRAADMDDGSAIYNLAICYEKGMGLEKDTAKAIELYRDALAHGVEEAGDDLRRLR